MKKIIKKSENSIVNLPNLLINANGNNFTLTADLSIFTGTTTYGNAIVSQAKNEVIEIGGRSYTLNFTLSERTGTSKAQAPVKTYTRAEILELVKAKKSAGKK
jgi:hypothetical protein